MRHCLAMRNGGASSGISNLGSGESCYIVPMAKPLVWFCSAGIALELIWILTCSLGPLREHTVPFLILMGLAFILCIWTYFRLLIRTRQATWLVLGFALLFRLTVLFAPPYQSEDVYRYLWDARTASMGVSPYAYPPDAPELEKFRDDRIYPMVNSKPYITAYPPVSQILFRFSFALFGDSVIAMKAIFSLFEFLALLIAWKLLIIWKQSVQPLLLMAWHPFFIFEFSASGHSDSTMMFLILLSIYLLCRNRKAWGMVSYAGAVLAKLHPALWFPLYLRRIGWKPALAGFIAGLGLVLLYFDPGSWLRYLNSLKLYVRLFEFNASIHYLIRVIGRVGFHASWDKEIGPYLGAVLLLIAVLILWKFPVRDARDILHAGFWLMTADLCLATTAHPWYIAWAALALPLFPYAFMTYWTGACFLSYIAYSYQPVYEPAWVLLLEYIPVYGLMAWEIRKRRPMMLAWLEQK
jgi:alpha-1,6-mannosyltransferase